MVRIPFLIAVLLSWLSASAHADRYTPAPPFDANADWCTDDLQYSTAKDRYLPDGAIVQIGPHYFRLCQGGSKGSTADRRVMGFFYNPRRVPGLLFDETMIGLMANSLSDWESYLARTLQYERKTRLHEFGGVGYQVYRFFDSVSQELGAKELYVYEISNTDKQDGPPPHMVTCSKNFDDYPAEMARCSLIVGYGEIFAKLLMIGGGDSSAPIPADKFPLIAADIVRVLEASDVTEERDTLSHLPTLE